MVRAFGENNNLVRYLVGIILLGLESLPSAWAQTQGDIDRARRQQDQIQRQQEERLRPDDSLIPRQLPPGMDRPDTAPSRQGPAAPAPCFPIQKIEIEGWDEDLNFLVANYVGQCIKATDLNAILARVTEYFVDRGLVTTRAYGG